MMRLQQGVLFYLKFIKKTLFQASNPSNYAEKRSVSEDVNVDIKKMKIETPMLEQKISMAFPTNTAAPKFVSAAKMAVPVSEISDEELLKFTLEFERTHGIQ